MSNFIFTIETTKKSQPFTLPLNEVVGNEHNFTVEWGDKSSSMVRSFDDKNRTHIYSEGGKYSVSIHGNCPWFSVNFCRDRFLFTSVDSWGDVGMVNLNGGLNGCQNLISIASDGQGLGNVEDFSSCFGYCRFTSVPVGLFDFCTKAINFDACFGQCDCLVSVPAGLFSHCTEAKSFVGCFCGCTELSAVPDKFFDTTTKATSFAVCFSNCEKINNISPTLFKNYSSTIDIKNAFYKTKITEFPVPGQIDIGE